MTEYAFPDPHLTHIKGMSLRDYFAAKALQGILANPERNSLPDGAAYNAYKYADAMMKERTK